MPTLSLCITCFDRDSVLVPRLLDHLENLTEKPDELIIIGSGLKSVDFEADKVFLFPDRKNAAAARNKGFEISSSELIMFFDVDDYPHPQKIEIAKRCFNHPIDALVHNYLINNTDFEKYETDGLLPGLAELAADNHVSPTNIKHSSNLPIHHAHITVRSDVSVRFNESHAYERREDGKFCQDLILAGYKIGFSEHKLVSYTS